MTTADTHKHSPLPWVVSIDSPTIILSNSDGRHVSYTRTHRSIEEDEANAAHGVRCVNIMPLVQAWAAAEGAEYDPACKALREALRTEGLI